MTAEIVPWPNSKGDGGGGPEDPMLEKRVEVLEQKVDRILAAIERLEPAIRDLAADNREFRKQLLDLSVKVASIDGQLKSIPSTWQMITFMLGSQIAFAGILFTALKFGLK